MKALLLDPNKGTVERIEIESGIQAIYEAIDCRTFAAPVTFPNGDTMYVDDEAFIVYENGGELGQTHSRDWGYPLLGKILILGTDEEGNSKDVTSTALEVAGLYYYRSFGEDKFLRYKVVESVK